MNQPVCRRPIRPGSQHGPAMGQREEGKEGVFLHRNVLSFLAKSIIAPDKIQHGFFGGPAGRLLRSMPGLSAFELNLNQHPASDLSALGIVSGNPISWNVS